MNKIQLSPREEQQLAAIFDFFRKEKIACFGEATNLSGYCSEAACATARILTDLNFRGTRWIGVGGYYTRAGHAFTINRQKTELIDVTSDQFDLDCPLAVSFPAPGYESNDEVLCDRLRDINPNDAYPSRIQQHLVGLGLWP